MDAVLERVGRAQSGPCAPRLAPLGTPSAQAPTQAPVDEKPPGRTIAYEQLQRVWQLGSDVK